MATKQVFIQTLKKMSAAAAISLFAFGSLLVIPASPASALTEPGSSEITASTDLFDTEFSPPEQARIWTSIQAALSGNKKGACQFDTVAAESQIASGNWFTGKVGIGYHFEPDDGFLECSNENKWFSNLLDKAGFEGDYLSLAEQVLKAHTTGDITYYDAKPDSRAILRGVFEQRFFGGSQVLRGGTPDHLTYSIMFANFTAANACKAVVAPSSPNELAKLKADGLLEQSIFVLENGETVKKDYVYDNHDGDGLHVGYNLPDDGGDDGKFKCISMASILHDSRYANALVNYLALNPNTPTTDTGSTNGRGQNDINLNCGSKASVLLNPLNWLICPIVEGLATTARALDRGINDLLEIKVDEVFKKTPGEGYYGAWQQMRIYAIIFLVIATLIIVISQALGFEFLDAYTVRKTLPRLLIAAVGITLSWEFMTFFVQFTNDLGEGIRTIIYAPFSKQIDGTISLGGGGLFVANLIGAGAIAALGVLGLLSFVATAALAVLIAFFVLVLRQLLIIVLIILAPVAIICYILPNTQKVWKLWWDSFSKGLLMFPIIVAFIAVGRVVAATAATKEGALYSFIAFIAYFAPYFLIPLTFRFAGGLLGNLGGFVNNRGRGAFDGLKNFRSNQSKQRRANAMRRAQTGKIFKNAGDSNSFRNKLNRGIQRGTMVNEAGFDPRRWGGRVNSAMSRSSELQRDAMLEDKDYVTKNDDDWNRAASEAGSESDFRRILSTDPRYADRYSGPSGADNLDMDVARYRTMNQRYGTSGMRQASFLQAVAGGTAFEGADVWRAAAMVAGNDDALLHTLVGKGRGLAMNAGRVDQGGGSFGETAGIAQKFRDDPTYTMEAANKDLRRSVRKSSGGATAAYGKPQSARSVAQAHAENISDLLLSMDSGAAMKMDDGTERVATDRDVKQAFAQAHGVHDALRSASPENAQAFADNLMGIGIKVSELRPETRAALGPSFQAQGVGQSSRGPGADAGLSVRQIMDDLAGRDQQYSELRTDFATGGLGAIESERQRQLSQTVGPASLPQRPTGPPNSR